MRKILVLMACALIAACTDRPQLGLGFNVGPGGVSVSPTVSGNVGGVNVGVAGSGVDL
jgi:hypothetical protein